MAVAASYPQASFTITPERGANLLGETVLREHVREESARLRSNCIRRVPWLR